MSPSSQHSSDKQTNPARYAHNLNYSHQQSDQHEQSSQQQQQQLESCSLLQRKLFGFLAIYAILLFALYLTCYSYQHLRLHAQSISEPLDGSESSADVSRLHLTSELVNAGGRPEVLVGGHAEQLHQDLEVRLESKIHLLERYIEVIAVDLQETKARLKEREKCDCPISCVFNSTRYADRSSWQHQCDTCTCQSGKISCSPQKCPQLACDDAITLPGQCCPTCMKKCKHNNQIIRHGQKFSPSQEPNKQGQAARKECKCHDGLIKCEQPIQLAGQTQNSIQQANFVSRQENASSGLINKVRARQSTQESRVTVSETEPIREKQQLASEREKTSQKWLPRSADKQTVGQLNEDLERKRRENG